MANEPDTKTLIQLNLGSALSEARNGKEGLTIEEVAEIMTEHFGVSELRQLIGDLNGKIDNADN